MKIEVGKAYRTRDGRKATIVGFDLISIFPFKGHISGEVKELPGDFEFSWTGTGIYLGTRHRLDLVAEWVDEPTETERLKAMNAELVAACQAILDASTPWAKDMPALMQVRAVLAKNKEMGK